jgi:uncharacterized membrane protein
MGKRLPLLVLAFIAVLYASVSWVNHFYFHTYALDLGLYTNALYDYSHLQWNDCSTFRDVSANLLSDHFDLLLFLFAPFSFLLKSWTLLVMQWVALIAGGYAFYLYFHERFSDRRLATFALLFYALQFAVFCALSYDYHSNVLAAALLPWFLLYLERGRLLKASLVFLLVLISKENMSLWMVFVLSGLATINRFNPWRRYLLLCSSVALLYFILITMVVMPAMDSSGKFVQFNYSILGTGYGSAFREMFSHPVRLFSALFHNHLGAFGVEGVKEEWWKFFLLSGGIILLIRPVYVWMLVPVFFQKMWSDRPQTWGVNDHYSMEIVPILVLGVFMVLGELKNSTARKFLPPVVTALALITTVSIMDRTTGFLHREQLRVYQGKHWVSAVDRDAYFAIASLIPDHASISAQSCLVPRLAWRDNCYSYPLVKDASLILLAETGDSYPLKAAGYFAAVDTLKSSVYWTLKAGQGGLLLFERK